MSHAPDQRKSFVAPEVTTSLLSDSSWRARTVRRADIDRARVYHESLSLQSSPIIEYIESYSAVGIAEEVDIVIPVDTLPKRPLVNFAISGPLGQTFMLKRRIIAEYETDFIAAVAGDAGVALDALAVRYCIAICEFTPPLWTQVWEEFGPNERPGAMLEYLRRNLPFAVDTDEFYSWLRRSEQVGAKLKSYLGEPTDNCSSADNPLLALPLALDLGADASSAHVDDALKSLESFVKSCDEASYPELHPLALLAAYGRRWEMLIQCRVPSEEPFVIHASRDVPMELSGSGWVDLAFRFNDSASNHVAVRLLDSEVKFRRTRALDLYGSALPKRNFVAFERSREDISAYGSEERRALDIRLRVQLAMTGTSTLAYWAFFVVLIGAIALLFVVKPLTSDFIAVIVVPTTFASAFLLVQQRTSLTARLQSLVRRLAIVALLTMWLVVGILYITQKAQT